MIAMPSGMVARVVCGLSWYSNAHILGLTARLAPSSDETDLVNTVRFVRRCP